MELTYKLVRGTQAEKPAEIDYDSSPSVVYLRRNIVRVEQEQATDGTTIKVWEYEEAVLSPEEYKQYKAEINSVTHQQVMNKLKGTATDENVLILMGAFAEFFEMFMAGDL